MHFDCLPELFARRDQADALAVSPRSLSAIQILESLSDWRFLYEDLGKPHVYNKVQLTMSCLIV